MVICNEIAAPEVPIEKAMIALCYPAPWDTSCKDRIRELRSLGITSILSYGRFRVTQFISVVGKGHAAVVLLARHSKHGIVAVKARRLDSKRSSLELEGRLLEIARETCFVPSVYAYTRNFIVREFIEGPTLQEYLRKARRDRESRSTLRMLFSRVALGFAKLDAIGIDVDEVSRPLTQIVIECGDPNKPKLIDLESARLSSRPSSLTRFLGSLARVVDGIPIFELLGLSLEEFRALRELASEYKRSVHSTQREKVVNRIISLLKGA